MQAENYSKGVLLAMVVNVVTTVGVVMVNKYIAAELRFNFMIFLSAIHFCFTGLFAYIAMKLGYFQYKSATVKQVLPLAFGSAFSVGFNNLSLGYNSVGTYQMAKLVCIPCTAWVQYKMLGVKLSQKEVISLAILLFGVGIATVTDLELNFWGSVYAACAILCTVAGQVLTKQYQKSLGLDAMQLLLHVCPLMTAILFVSSPILETMRGYSPLGLLDYYAFMQNEVAMTWLVTCVFVTCLFAFGINSSNYIVIGQTSPITYQVDPSHTCMRTQEHTNHPQETHSHTD